MTDEADLDDAPYPGTQILWGRVLVLLLALALAFWLGTTFGGDDGSRQEIRDQADEIARLEAQIANLDAELAARDAAAQDGSEQASDVPSAVASAETSQRRQRNDGPTTAAGGADVAARDDRAARTDTDKAARARRSTDPPKDEQPTRRYVIQSGDSLAAIAQEVYGDPTQWRAIARANDLQAPYSLTVGSSLQIPPAP